MKKIVLMAFSLFFLYSCGDVSSSKDTQAIFRYIVASGLVQSVGEYEMPAGGSGFACVIPGSFTSNIMVFADGKSMDMIANPLLRVDSINAHLDPINGAPPAAPSSNATFGIVPFGGNQTYSVPFSLPLQVPAGAFYKYGLYFTVNVTEIVNGLSAADLSGSFNVYWGELVVTDKTDNCIKAQ